MKSKFSNVLAKYKTDVKKIKDIDKNNNEELSKMNFDLNHHSSSKVESNISITKEDKKPKNYLELMRNFKIKQKTVAARTDENTGYPGYIRQLSKYSKKRVDNLVDPELKNFFQVIEVDNLTIPKNNKTDNIHLEVCAVESLSLINEKLIRELLIENTITLSLDAIIKQIVLLSITNEMFSYYGLSNEIQKNQIAYEDFFTFRRVEKSETIIQAEHVNNISFASNKTSFDNSKFSQYSDNYNVIANKSVNKDNKDDKEL